MPWAPHLWETPREPQGDYRAIFKKITRGRREIYLWSTKVVWEHLKDFGYERQVIRYWI